MFVQIFKFAILPSAAIGASCDPLSISGEVLETTCKVATTNNFVELYIGLNETAEIVSLCAVNTDGEGYIGIGMGERMDDGFVSVIAGAEHNVYDIVGQTMPQVATDNKGITLVRNNVVNKRRHSCFVLPTSLLYPNGSASISSATFAYAIGNTPSLARHDLRGTFNVDLKTLRGSVWSITAPVLLIVHVGIQVVAFGLLFPLGALVAFYAGPHFQRGAVFFKAHLILMICGVILAIAGLACAFAYSSVDTPHGIGGLVVFTLVVLQPINGALRPVLEHKNRRMWEIIHKCIGRVSILLGFAVMLLGAKTFTQNHGNEVVLFILVGIPITICVTLAHVIYCFG